MITASRDEGASKLAAETAVANLASRRVLERNAFEAIGTRWFDPMSGGA